MRNLFWIQRHRQQIFAFQILVSIIFGPGISKALNFSGWIALGITLGIFILLEVALAFTRLTLAKLSHGNTKKTYEKTKAAHAQIKKDYQELTGEPLQKVQQQPRKQPRRKKGKKTHRM